MAYTTDLETTVAHGICHYLFMDCISGRSLRYAWKRINYKRDLLRSQFQNVQFFSLIQ
jgi:hypothetical protein